MVRTRYVGGWWWDAAARQVLGDPYGEDIRASQALWARALREEFGAGSDVACAGWVFGPALIRAGTEFVVSRSDAVVESGNPAAAMAACEAAWPRWQAVDDNGEEQDEVHPDELAGDGVEVGYPVVTSEGVRVGFDVREREEPLPHRALTCLRILVEELRRHGATPAVVLNGSWTADDRGVKVQALADHAEDVLAAQERARAAAPPRYPRPTWLPAFHRVTRSRRASPSGPVPFAVLASTGVWAWDPSAGLLKLPGWQEHPTRHTSMRAQRLTPDGTTLIFRHGNSAVGTPLSERVKIGAYDVVTAETTLAPWSGVTSYAASASGPWLKVTPKPAPPRVPSFADDTYELLEGPDRTGRRLPLRGRVLPGGVHFSPSGRRLLTGHIVERDHNHVLTVTDLHTGEQIQHAETRVYGSAPWSPDETRCLVEVRRTDGYSGVKQAVLNLHSGHRTTLRLEPDDPIDPDDEPISRRRATALGWLDNHGIAISQDLGRRIRICYQSIDNTARYPILDLPINTPSVDVKGVDLAAHVLARAPAAIGYS